LHISAYAIAFFSISAHFLQRKHTRTRHLRHIFPNATYTRHILAHISPNSAYFSRIFYTKTARIF